MLRRLLVVSVLVWLVIAVRKRLCESVVHNQSIGEAPQPPKSRNKTVKQQKRPSKVNDFAQKSVSTEFYGIADKDEDGLIRINLRRSSFPLCGKDLSHPVC